MIFFSLFSCLYVCLSVQVTKTKWCELSLDEKLILEKAIEKGKEKFNGRDVATILGKIHTHMSTYIHTCIHTHACTHTNTHTHILTHTHADCHMTWPLHTRTHTFISSYSLSQNKQLITPITHYTDFRRFPYFRSNGKQIITKLKRNILKFN